MSSQFAQREENICTLNNEVFQNVSVLYTNFIKVMHDTNFPSSGVFDPQK